MWSKGLILVFALVFTTCYVIGIKTLRSRLLLLVGLVVCLMITIPNCRHDRALFMQKDITEFTQHLQQLMDKAEYETAHKSVVDFNRGFPSVGRDTEERFHFVQELIKRNTAPELSRNSSARGVGVSPEPTGSE